MLESVGPKSADNADCLNNSGSRHKGNAYLPPKEVLLCSRGLTLRLSAVRGTCNLLVRAMGYSRMPGASEQ